MNRQNRPSHNHHADHCQHEQNHRLSRRHQAPTTCPHQQPENVHQARHEEQNHGRRLDQEQTKAYRHMTVRQRPHSCPARHRAHVHIRGEDQEELPQKQTRAKSSPRARARSFIIEIESDDEDSQPTAMTSQKSETTASQQQAATADLPVAATQRRKRKRKMVRPGMTFGDRGRLDVHKILREYPEGMEISGFTVLRSELVDELDLTAILLRHEDTGCKYLHLARNDTDNVFATMFRTIPEDSTGAPHILEHYVLNGSERYPIRDALLKMMTRSVYSFMNAFTADDFTLYPFSTTNAKDFNNLLSVYMDGIFRPLLKELDFMQEGWRLEPLNPADPEKSDWVLKGIVLNEMKGVYSDPHGVMRRKTKMGLYPSGPYGQEAGGDPLKIPDLSWEGTKEFYRRNYHPSNCKMYSYGDMCLKDHLEFVKKYLNKFQTKKRPPLRTITEEPRWSEPRELKVHYQQNPSSKDGNKAAIAVTYALTPIKNDFENFSLKILSELLVSGPNAPFYKCLQESPLGTGMLSFSGYEGLGNEPYFLIGLQGVNESQKEDVMNMINKTFKRVEKEGISPERIEVALHSIELALRHQQPHFGIVLLSAILDHWNHDNDPIMMLKINQYVDKFRETVQNDPEYLGRLVRKYFIDNQHRLTTILLPKADVKEEREKAEIELVRAKLAPLNPSQRQDLAQKCVELHRLNEQEQDKSVLPILQLDDVEVAAPPCDLVLAIAAGVPFQLCALPTNGVTYFKAIIHTGGVPEKHRKYVALFADVLTEMGADGLDYKELNHEVMLRTGGLQSTSIVHSNPLFPDLAEQTLLLGSFCLNRNTPYMFDIWRRIFTGFRPTNDRLKNLIKQELAAFENSLITSAHTLALITAAKCLSAAAALNEEIMGLPYLKFLREITSTDESLQKAADTLREICEKVLDPRSMTCAINTSQDFMNDALKLAERFVGGIPAPLGRKGPGTDIIALLGRLMEKKATGGIGAKVTEEIIHKKTNIVLHTPVYWSAMVVKGVDFLDKDFSCLELLAQIVEWKFLMREFREKRGAYGAAARVLPIWRIFAFFSFRDPTGKAAFDLYEKAINWVLTPDSFSEDDVHEAKLSVFQAENAPQPPGSRGMVRFLRGINDDVRTTHKQQLLSITKEDIQRAGRKYLQNRTQTGMCLMGPEVDNAEGDWDIIHLD